MRLVHAALFSFAFFCLLLVSPAQAAKIIELRADAADGAAAHGVPGAASPWSDLIGTHDAALANFSGDASSGWKGNGTPTSPSRLHFDGVDDVVTIPAASVPQLNPATTYSAGMWVRTGSNVSSSQYLMEWGETFGAPYAGMTFDISGGNLRVWLGTPGPAFQNVTAVAANTWYHVLVAKEPGEARVYVNGALQYTNAADNIGDQASEIVIGAATFSGAGLYSNYFGGDIAQVSIFDHALDDAQALTEFQVDQALYASPVKLVELRADQADGAAPYPGPGPGAGATWADLTGLHDGTLQNFTGTAASGWLGDGTPVAPHHLRFDGVKDLVTIPGASVPELNPASTYSASVWLRTGSDITRNQYVMEWLSAFGSPFAGTTLGIEGGNLRIFLNPWATVAPVQPNTWYHVLAAKEAGEVRVYLDGVLTLTSASPNLGSQVSEIVIGASTFRGANTYGEYFGGDIAQVCVFGSALNDAEALTQYQADEALYSNASVKIAQYRADQADGAGPYTVPGAGTPWVDLSGTHDGTLANFAGDATGGWQGSGVAGDPYRLRFDGVDSRVTVPAGSVGALNPAGSYSASMWLRTGPDVTSNQYLMEWAETFAAPWAGMTFGIEGGNLRVWQGTPGPGWQVVAAVSADTWYHVVVTKAPSDLRVYLNGSLEYTSAVDNIGDQVSEVVIGSSTFGGAGVYGNPFGGAIAQVCIFKGALDAPGVTAEFQADEALYLTPPVTTKLVQLRADQADGNAPYPIPGAGSPWVDLANTHDAELVSFAGDTSSGWLGDGTVASPYRLKFDGTDDVARIPAGSIPGLQGSATTASMSMWFQTGADVTRQQYLMEWFEEAYAQPYSGMTVGISAGQVIIYQGPVIGFSNAAGTVLPDTWYHLAVSKDAAGVRVYLNGNLILDDPNANLGDQVSEVVLGAGTFSGFQNYAVFFEGAIAQACIWTGALVESEVVAQFQADQALYIPPPATANKVVQLRADQADGALPYSSPGAGSPWMDLTNDHDAELVNIAGDASSGWLGDGTTISPHRLELDGVDDLARIPAGSIPELQGGITSASMTMWFRSGIDVIRQQYLLEWFEEAYTSPFSGMTVGILGGQLVVYQGPVEGFNNSAGAILPNTWYHVAVVKDATSVRVYLDGVLTLDHPVANLGDQVSEVVLGAGTFGGFQAYSTFFEGAIAQACIWEGALSESEVLAEVQADESLYRIQPDTATKIAQFRADQADGVNPPAVVPAATPNPWVDLVNSHDATLFNFDGTGASGWQGTGSLAAPYRLRFDGVDDVATIPAGSIPELNPAGAYSVAAWIRTGNDVATNQYVMEWAETFAAPYAGMTWAVEGGNLRIWLGTPGPSWQAVAPVSADTWYHVVVSKTPGLVRVYVNGVLEFSNTVDNIGDQVSEIVIGASTFSGAGAYDNFFRGDIAQLCILDGAMGDAAALAEYQSDQALYGGATGPAVKLAQWTAGAADGAAAYPVPGAASPWVDLANDHDAELVNFTGDATSGWQGDGTPALPHRLKFDGVDDVVRVPGGSIPELQTGITAASMTMWFQAGADVSTSQYLMEWLEEPYASPFSGMTVGIQNGQLVVYQGPIVGFSNPVGSIEPLNWYHVAVSKDAAGVRVYLDGALLLDDPTANVGDQVSEVVLGAGTFPGFQSYTAYFGGSIGQACIWGGAMTQAQVTDDFTAGAPLYPDVADLSLSKTISNPTPSGDDQISFTLFVNNAGPNDATGVEVLDLLPTGYTYVGDDSGGAYDANTGVWTVGSVDLGQTRSIIIDVIVNNDPLDFTNVAQVSASDQLDPDSTPNNDDGDQSEDDESSAAPDVVTPVLVSNFEARVVGSDVRVRWETLDGEGLAGFHVLRGVDSAPLRRVNQDQLPASRLHFLDEVEGVREGADLVYRLEVVLTDGSVYALGSEVRLEYVPQVPKAFALEQNAPNPFNPKTSIRFSLQRGGATSLRVYDVAGHLVATLLDEHMEPGFYSVEWNGTDTRGRTVATGTYYYRLQSGRELETRRMTLVK